MTAAAIIAGSYADFKVIKTRSVVSISIEIPIEQADTFISTFGMPIPGSEKPVALALMNTEPEQPEKGKKSWAEMGRAQQAGILCNDPRFQDWCGATSADGAADFIRRECGVHTRAHLDMNKKAAGAFDQIVTNYRQANGHMAEARR